MLLEVIMNRFIPLSIPNFEGNEKKYVNEALDQGWVSTGGAYVTKLEESMQKFLHVDNMAVCQSGTSALHMSLIEAGVGSGDIVIVPALTFIAAVNPVKYQHANPVFMDCDESLCMDPVKLRQFCEEECVFSDGTLKYNNQIVKAIIVVHVFGNMADMVSIIEIAHEYNIRVIEDATEALGTYYIGGQFAGRYAGTIGDFGAYSFNGNKIITTGGGGAVTSNDSKVVNHLRYLSTQAKDDPHNYIHNEIGYNYRMTNIQAAMGVAQMEELSEFIRRKNENYDYYCKLFDKYELGRMIGFRKETTSNKWFYSLEINREKVKASLQEIITELEKQGVQTRAIWGLINEQRPYQSEAAYKIEKAKYYADRIINIPCSTQISREEIEYVVKKIKEILENFEV